MFFKPNSFKDYFFHLIIVGIIAVGIFIYFFNYYLPEYTRHGEELIVPELSGKHVTEAEDILSELNLRYHINDSAFVEGKKPGIIMTQHPLEGSTVKANRKIYLSVTSRYPTNIPMPSLENKTYKAANLILSQNGLYIGDTTIVEDQFKLILKATLNGKEVTPGTMVPKYSKIDLKIGSGQAEEEEQEVDSLGVNTEQTPVFQEE